MWWLVLCISLPLIDAKCYWSNKYPYSYFGGKTPYEAVRGDFRDVPPIRGCKPVSIWFMTRHGTRHPSEVESAEMKEASHLKDKIIRKYYEGKGEMCAQDIANLRDWQWDDIEEKPLVLTSEGAEELLEFGQRFREKFSSFLDHLNQSLIRSTDEVRTRKSAKAFITGLDDIGPKLYVDTPIREDATARPYRFCKRRGAEVMNSSLPFYEMHRYEKTPEFMKLKANLKKRIGFDHEVNTKTIMALYNLCRFYRLYSEVNRNAWCALFTDNELEILEYVEDIKQYFRDGHGHPMNGMLGASGLKDLYEKFEAATASGRSSFTGYFTHGTMIQMMYAALGLYYDYPEISGLERIRNRKWRTSFLVPFVANFVAVLHRCTKDQRHLYRIQFFSNEKELHLCVGRVCSWDDFKEKFQQFANASIDFCDATTTLYYI